MHLRTLFVLNDAGRILSTREPGINQAPLFSLVRSTNACVWAVRADIPADLCNEIDRLARDEAPISDFRDVPTHAEQYVSLLSETPNGSAIRQFSGPAFEFPDSIAEPEEVVLIQDEALLQRHFRGWIPGEIAEGRAPVMAICEGGEPVSVCFCAKSSDLAAEAGVETAEAFRRRGLAVRVTAAWALAIRKQGRIPMYSTAWTNLASLAVARRLGLRQFANNWSLFESWTQ